MKKELNFTPHERGKRVRLEYPDACDLRKGRAKGDTGVTMTSGPHPTVKFDSPTAPDGLMMGHQLEVIEEPPPAPVSVTAELLYGRRGVSL